MNLYQRLLPHGMWLVTLLAGFLRFWNLGYPHKLVFDETYYVKDAWSLWNLGYEGTWPSNANPAFEAGHTDGFIHIGSFVVHPPLGKWLIAIPMAIWGPQNSWTWRFSTALIGTLAVLLLILVAKKLTGSQSFAILAGFIMAIDGHAIVLSRVALLDGIVMFFALLAFYFLLLDRERSRVFYQKLALTKDTSDRLPVLFNRPWLVACAVALAATTATKWSGLYFAAFFGLYVVVSEALLRRRLGLPNWAFNGFVRQGVANIALMVPVYAFTYLATWTGWIITKDGWGRGTHNNWWNDLLAYEKQIYDFHVNLRVPHSYASNPFTWLYEQRPVAMYYQATDCPAWMKGWLDKLPNGCNTAIDAIGNPFIWWGAFLAIVYLTYHYLRFRNRTEGLILLGIGAGYLPWLLYTQRTVFQFYSIAFFPFSVLALTYVIRSLWYRPKHSAKLPGRYWYAWRPYIFVYLVAVVAISAFFLSLWWGFVTPYAFWAAHMWLGPLWI